MNALELLNFLLAQQEAGIDLSQVEVEARSTIWGQYGGEAHTIFVDNIEIYENTSATSVLVLR